MSDHPLLLDIFSQGPPQLHTGLGFLFSFKVSFEKHPNDGLLNSRLKISYMNLRLTKRADNSALYRVDMTKVAELEDMVKKNSEYQKLLQNKIKEMQMIEKRKEEERLSRESELVERLRELEEQSRDQVGGIFS